MKASKIRYKNIELEFGPDDRLLCYTEGLVTRGPGYTIRQGLMSLLKTLDESKNAKPEEIAGQLQKLWHGFGIKGKEIENDVTFTLFFQGQQADLENRQRPVPN
ncbi:SpoIIE family protein phosphatase [bacterium]|nr:SpoIIE family protein phosphatase [bacterium]